MPGDYDPNRQHTGPIGGNSGMSIFSDILDTVGDAYGQYAKYKYGGNAISSRYAPAPPSTGINLGGYNFSFDAPLVDVKPTPTGGTGMSCGTGCDSPRYMKYDCKTGELKPIRRRRRRPTLTPTQMAQLQQIGTLKNTDLVKTAIANMLK